MIGQFPARRQVAAVTCAGAILFAGLGQAVSESATATRPGPAPVVQSDSIKADQSHAVTAARVTPLQATADEWWVGLSRRSVRAGTIEIEFVNFGEDDHDLAITRSGGETIATFETVRPNSRASLSTTVTRGRYVFWCGVAGHKRRGMRAVLTVRR